MKRAFNSIQQPESQVFPPKPRGAAGGQTNIGTEAFEQIVEYRAEVAKSVKVQKGGVPPAPSRRGGVGGRVKYPFEQMGINDHFQISFEPGVTPAATKSSLDGYWRRFLEKHKLQWKFITVIEEDGVSVWRVQ